MGEQQIKDGEVIFREGDVSDVAYVVVSGKVELSEISQGNEVIVEVVPPGKIFGELALFDAQALRRRTAKASGAVVTNTVSPEEFTALVSKCPPALQPFLTFAFEKLRAVKTKNKAVMSQDIALESGLTKITVAPASDKMKEQFKPVTVQLSQLPFKIGGYPEGGEPNRRDQLQLHIACQASPLRVSRQHCEIIVDSNRIMLTDLASRFCTHVNGAIIGRGYGVYTTPLKKGVNEITLG